MLVFELAINGKLLARAGQEDLCVLSSCVSAVGVLGPESAGARKKAEGTDIHVHLGGMTAKKDGSKEIHLDWIPLTELRVGDEIEIKIVEAESADKPVKTLKPVDPAARERVNYGKLEMDLDKSPNTMAADWRGQLIRGGPYFTVSYLESGVNLPEVETLVYLGSTQMEAPLRTGYLFQAAHSYQEDGDWSELPEQRRQELAADGAVMFYDEDSVGSVADIDGLLVLLNRLRERMRRGLGWDRVLPDEQ